MSHHIAKSGPYAYSPDYQHNDVPGFNGGDGLFAGGYSPIDGGRFLLRSKDGKPEPLFSQRSMYGLGLTRIAPFGSGTSYAAGDFFDARWVPDFGYAVAGTLSRPCRTLIFRGNPPNVASGDLYAAVNAAVQDVLDLHVVVQGIRFQPATAAGFNQFTPPLAALFPKLAADARDVTSGDGSFPSFAYPDTALFRGGEALVIDFWDSAVANVGFIGDPVRGQFSLVDATIHSGGSTSDGIGSYNYTRTIRIPSDPGPDGDTYVYFASFSDIFSDARGYANDMATRFARYSHVVVRPAATDYDVSIEGDVIDDLISGYDFAEDAGPAAGDAASVAADIVERAKAFFSAG